MKCIFVTYIEKEDINQNTFPEMPLESSKPIKTKPVLFPQLPDEYFKLLQITKKLTKHPSYDLKN